MPRIIREFIVWFGHAPVFVENHLPERKRILLCVHDLFVNRIIPASAFHASNVRLPDPGWIIKGFLNKIREMIWHIIWRAAGPCRRNTAMVAHRPPWNRNVPSHFPPGSGSLNVAAPSFRGPFPCLKLLLIGIAFIIQGKKHLPNDEHPVLLTYYRKTQNDQDEKESKK